MVVGEQSGVNQYIPHEGGLQKTGALCTKYTINNQEGKDINEIVLDSGSMRSPGKGVKETLSEPKEKEASNENASTASLSSEFSSL